MPNCVLPARVGSTTLASAQQLALQRYPAPMLLLTPALHCSCPQARSLPATQAVIDAVAALVRAHPQRRVLLSAEGLGTEEAVAGVAAATGLRAYIPPGCGPADLAAVAAGCPPLLAQHGFQGQAAGGSGGPRTGGGRGDEGPDDAQQAGATGGPGAAQAPGPASGCACCFATEALHAERVAELAELLGPGVLTGDPASRLWVIGGRNMRWLARAATACGRGGQQQRGAMQPAQQAPEPALEQGQAELLAEAPLIVRVSCMITLMRDTELLAGPQPGAGRSGRGAPAAVASDLASRAGQCGGRLEAGGVAGGGPSPRALAAALRRAAGGAAPAPLWEDGGVHYAVWARHSSVPELRAALQVLRPRAVAAFVGCVRPLAGASPVTELLTWQQADARLRRKVAAAAAAAARERRDGQRQLRQGAAAARQTGSALGSPVGTPLASPQQARRAPLSPGCRPPAGALAGSCGVGGKLKRSPGALRQWRSGASSFRGAVWAAAARLCSPCKVSPDPKRHHSWPQPFGPSGACEVSALVAAACTGPGHGAGRVAVTPGRASPGSAPQSPADGFSTHQREAAPAHVAAEATPAEDEAAQVCKQACASPTSPPARPEACLAGAATDRWPTSAAGQRPATRGPAGSRGQRQRLGLASPRPEAAAPAPEARRDHSSDPLLARLCAIAAWRMPAEDLYF